MKAVLVLPAVLLVGLILLLQIDDELSLESETLIGRVDTSGDSEAYLYLLGIYAHASENPVEVGRQVLDEYRKFEMDSAYEIVEYDESEKLTLPRGTFFCRTWEEGCLNTLFQSDFNIDDVQMDDGILVSRSNQFHSFSEFRTLTKPSASERIPSYHYISAAERIKVLSAITLHSEGRSADAILALEHQFYSLRHSLALQDNLIGKLVFLMLLSEVLDVSSVISSEARLPVAEISRLTLEEKGFSLVAAREFAMAYSVFKELDRHPEFFNESDNLPGWMVRMLYKPNMTINAVAPVYSRLEALSLLTPAQFAQEIKDANEVGVATSRVRNYAGKVLASFSVDGADHVGRFMDFDAKIVLFNHLNEGFDTAVNPYYEGDAPQVFQDKVCFRGPLDDTRSLRCLRTGL